MIRMIDDDKRISVYEADNIYKGCNYLMLHVSKQNGLTYGIVYAVSDDGKTHLELVKLEKELQREGFNTLIGGEYRDAVGISEMRYERIA